MQMLLHKKTTYIYIYHLYISVKLKKAAYRFTYIQEIIKKRGILIDYELLDLKIRKFNGFSITVYLLTALYGCLTDCSAMPCQRQAMAKKHFI